MAKQQTVHPHPLETGARSSLARRRSRPGSGSGYRKTGSAGETPGFCEEVVTHGRLLKGSVLLLGSSDVETMSSGLLSWRNGRRVCGY